MTEVTRQTVTTANTGAPVRPVVREATVAPRSFTAQNLIYFIFGAIEFMLAFRLIFKLAGANPGSGFVSFIYGATSPFVMPFAGIFRNAVTSGVEVRSVLEPGTLIAIPVYGLISWGLVKLIAILTKEPEV